MLRQALQKVGWHFQWGNRPAKSASWTVAYHVVGLSLTGVPMLGLVVVPTTSDPDALVMEVCAGESLVERREIHPEPDDDGRYVVVAAFPKLFLTDALLWRIGSPGTQLAEVRQRASNTGMRTRIARIGGQTIVIPGDYERLITVGMRTLHHTDCHVLKWTREALLFPCDELFSVLSFGVGLCRACIAYPPDS